MGQLSPSELILNKDGSIYNLNLKPEHISDTVITVGDPSRVYRVSQFFDDLEFEMNKREFITHIGTYKGKKVTVISTGMGTDNIEVVLTELDALVNIDLKERVIKKDIRPLNIIRIGTSESLQNDIAIGSHLVTQYAVSFGALMNFYNLNQTAFENSISNEVQRAIKLHFRPYCVSGSQELIDRFASDMILGNTVTCPGFYAPQGRKLRIDLRIPNMIEDLIYFHKDDFWFTNLDMETAGYFAMSRLLGHKMLSVNAIIANRANKEFSKNPEKIVDGLIKKILDRL